MKKVIMVSAALLAVFCLSSCLSLEGLLYPDYSVHYGLSEEQVNVGAAKVEAEKTYFKKFTAKDSKGKLHDVIIYDDYYLKMDDMIYAFRYDKMMYYKLSLNLIVTQLDFEGSEKLIGFTCWATSLSNPDLTVHIIFARELFAHKHYNSQYEAAQINGVYFESRKADDGYIDAWGRWKRYKWSDYFEEIFGTANQDVNQRMYTAVEVY